MDMAKILIVEDEAKIARFLELELKHEGYEVAHAADRKKSTSRSRKTFEYRSNVPAGFQ